MKKDLYEELNKLKKLYPCKNGIEDIVVQDYLVRLNDDEFNELINSVHIVQGKIHFSEVRNNRFNIYKEEIRKYLIDYIKVEPIVDRLMIKYKNKFRYFIEKEYEPRIVACAMMMGY